MYIIKLFTASILLNNCLLADDIKRNNHINDKTHISINQYEIIGEIPGELVNISPNQQIRLWSTRSSQSINQPPQTSINNSLDRSKLPEILVIR
jgi:hypothetical protein